MRFITNIHILMIWILLFLPLRLEAQENEETIYWVENAYRDHGYNLVDTAKAAGIRVDEIEEMLRSPRFPKRAQWRPGPYLKVLPYPGGRHPRLGFLEGAMEPERGTKVSLFTPWDEYSYVVIDVPEAIFSNLGLIYLAHKHIPTLWDAKGIKLPAMEWTRNADGSLSFSRTLPNRIAFGTKVTPMPDGVEMEMWLRNDMDEPLSNLRTQVCVLLKGAKGFESQIAANKSYQAPIAAAVSSRGGRYILTAWEPCNRVWGNERCPCLHSDPEFPDCPPGETVHTRGRVRFYEGDRVNEEFERLAADLR